MKLDVSWVSRVRERKEEEESGRPGHNARRRMPRFHTDLVSRDRGFLSWSIPFQFYVMIDLYEGH
jgi:hypothetical protein